MSKLDDILPDDSDLGIEEAKQQIKDLMLEMISQSKIDTPKRVGFVLRGPYSAVDSLASDLRQKVEEL